MSLPPPNESNVFETVTNDTEHVGEISDDKTQQLLNLTVSACTCNVDIVS